ncbi:MAG: Maf family protein [Oscillospiraceae bacterium]|nr:septum formation protein Maf [Oscillospiraceae bacterium]MDD5965099.1 Maf family protein [Oscillospiraceae bacterium]MDD7538707.1 Maf family protein [Oscillospiraceae bacterium]MDY5735278.1 Maf family protein [Oscillospiraceae bacterium]MDY6020899.1 Maf family protein [Oscillospiraceae bacterium]
MAIILASQSPRRQELLRKMGVRDFRTMSLDVDESYPAGLSPEETVVYISRKKSDAAAALVSPDELVITADTMVFLDNDRLGKPHDEADALRMLTELSGRRHTVCTGVTVRRGGESEAFSVSTNVYFRTCGEAELRAYIATGEPMDKAGAYGIQGLGSLFVEKIDGDFYNVMGLPVERLGRTLARFGVNFF